MSTNVMLPSTVPGEAAATADAAFSDSVWSVDEESAVLRKVRLKTACPREEEAFMPVEATRRLSMACLSACHNSSSPCSMAVCRPSTFSAAEPCSVAVEYSFSCVRFSGSRRSFMPDFLLLTISSARSSMATELTSPMVAHSRRSRPCSSGRSPPTIVYVFPLPLTPNVKQTLC